MKTRPSTFILALVLLVVVLFIAVGEFLIKPRARHVAAQNEEARAYIDAMTRLVSSNARVSHFRMDLIRAGLEGGTIDVRVTLVSTNDEAELIRLLHSQSTPYAVGGTVGFADSSNLHQISIAP